METFRCQALGTKVHYRDFSEWPIRFYIDDPTLLLLKKPDLLLQCERISRT
jgi:hypothetical protein